MHRLILAAALIVACNQPSSPATSTAAVASPAPGNSDLPDTVAVVAGEKISRADLEEKAAPGVMAAMQKAHEAREEALQGMIIDKLLEAEAKKAGTDIPGLLKVEIEDKAPMPTEDEIQAFYESNKARIGQPLEVIREQLVNHLAGPKRQELMTTYLDKLKADNNVEVFLEPYRIEVAARTNAARKGSIEAPIQIVEFSDFQCPYCTRAAETMEEVVEAYGDKVSFQYRHFPLDFHDRAHRAAEASECANDQGKFWPYHDLLFANQKAMSEENLKSYAEQSGLDVAAFDTCMASGKHAKTVDDDMAAGARVGMSGTPGFYVNGRMLTGAQPFAEFKRVIDEELKSKGIQ